MSKQLSVLLQFALVMFAIMTIASQPRIRQLVQQNYLMVRWTATASWIVSESGPRGPFDPSLSRYAGELSSRFSALCQGSKGKIHTACIQEQAIDALTDTETENILDRITSCDHLQDQWVLLPAIVGDMAYARGDRLQAVRIWTTCLPRKVRLMRAYQVIISHDDLATADSLLNKVSPGYQPDSLKSQISVTASQLALYHLRRGNLEAAEGYWRRAVEIAPDEQRYRHGLGNVLAQQQRWNEAIAVYDEAIKREPRHAATWAGLAWVYLRMGNLEKATEVAQHALALDPNQSTAIKLLQLLPQ